MVCVDATSIAVSLIGIAMVFLYMGTVLEGLMRFLKPLFFFLAYLTILFTIHTLLIQLNADATYDAVTALLTTFEIINIPIMITVFTVYFVNIYVEMKDDIIKFLRRLRIIK